MVVLTASSIMQYYYFNQLAATTIGAAVSQELYIILPIVTVYFYICFLYDLHASKK